MIESIRVLDRTTEIAGPYCAKLFADAGAVVVGAVEARPAAVLEQLGITGAHVARGTVDAGRRRRVAVVEEGEHLRAHEDRHVAVAAGALADRHQRLGYVRPSAERHVRLERNPRTVRASHPGGCSSTRHLHRDGGKRWSWFFGLPAQLVPHIALRGTHLPSRNAVTKERP